MKKILIALLFVTSIGLQLDAQQKFGHLNSSQLLTEMQEIKSANAELETYQKQLMSKGQKMVTDLQTKVQGYKVEYDSGTLSALQAQQVDAEIQKDQEAIRAYEIDMQQKIGNKRETLYKPLLDKVKNAIAKIGKEKGYTMIFDTSVPGAIVHAQITDDVTALVKAELGIQ
jgi:outer membrane protein